MRKLNSVLFYWEVHQTTHVVMCIVLVSLIKLCSCSDDYEYLQRIYAQQERQVRSQTASQTLENGGLYSIESVANHLYLTAKNGLLYPGPAILKKYSESGSQFWSTVKYDTSRGYNLKPLSNEFNDVTSTLANNAHAYNAWEFKPVKFQKHQYIIFNALNRRCLQTAKLKESVEFVKCEPENRLQHWKLHRIE